MRTFCYEHQSRWAIELHNIELSIISVVLRLTAQELQMENYGTGLPPSYIQGEFFENISTTVKLFLAKENRIGSAERSKAHEIGSR